MSKRVGLKSSLKKGSLVFADLPEIAQCMFREEIGWHLHRQAFGFRFCCVRNSIAPICQFGKKPFCFLTVGLVADFQITGLGNGVAFPAMEEVPPYFFASDTVWKLSISGIRAREEPFSHRI